jgi:hypothetical protein
MPEVAYSIVAISEGLGNLYGPGSLAPDEVPGNAQKRCL